MFARIQKPDEPFDITMFGWIGDTPDPSEFMDMMIMYSPGGAAIDDTPAGARLRAAAQATGAERIDAYAALDGDIAAQDAPFAQVMNNTRTDFFSARIGCQVEHPLYGIDLAALCLRD